MIEMAKSEKKTRQSGSRGERSFTRKQRQTILSILATAASNVIGQDSAMALVGNSKADVEPLVQAVKEAGDVVGAIAAYELAAFPMPSPVNKGAGKPKPEKTPKPAKGKATPVVARAGEPEPAAV
jgi:hypothetical protein